MTDGLLLYVTRLPCGHRTWHDQPADVVPCPWCERCWPVSADRWTSLVADDQAARDRESLMSLLHARADLMVYATTCDVVSTQTFELLRAADRRIAALVDRLDSLPVTDRRQGRSRDR